MHHTMQARTCRSLPRMQQQQLQQCCAQRPPFVAGARAAARHVRCRAEAATTTATAARTQQQADAVPSGTTLAPAHQRHAATDQQDTAPSALTQRAAVAAPLKPLRQHQPQQGLSRLVGSVKAVRDAASAAVNAVDPRMRGLIALNLMTLLMSSNWVLVKASNDSFDPMVFTSLRFTLAAAAFFPFLLKGLKDKTIRNAGLEIGAWTALGYLAQSWALFLTAASRASLLSTFTVIAVPCLAGLSGQRVKPLVWACGLAALGGTMLLEQGGGEPPNAGDLLSILSALFFALQIFRTERATRELPKGSNLPFMAITLATVALASCGSTAVVHWQDAAASLSTLWHVLGTALSSFGPGESPANAAHPLYELFWTSFCSTDLVLLIELVALQSVSSTEAALIYSLEPVSGAAMAYAFLGERWGPLGWWGAGLILAASIACQMGGAIEDDGASGGGGSGGGVGAGDAQPEHEAAS